MSKPVRHRLPPSGEPPEVFYTEANGTVLKCEGIIVSAIIVNYIDNFKSL